MNVKQLIEHLQQLDPETNHQDAMAWIKASNVSLNNRRTLSVEQSGKAIQIIKSILGSPYVNSNKNQSGKEYTFRQLAWREKDRTTQQSINVTNELLAADITDFWITDCGWFTIRIPFDATLKCFKGDPAFWERNIKANTDARLAEEERDRLWRIQRNKAFEEQQEKWRAEYPEFQRKTAERVAREAKIKLLGEQALEVEAIVDQAQVTDISKSRIINLEEQR